MTDERIDCAVQVTLAATRLLDLSGAFLLPALIANLDSTGWREEEVLAVLDVLKTRGSVVGPLNEVWTKGPRA